MISTKNGIYFWLGSCAMKSFILKRPCVRYGPGGGGGGGGGGCTAITDLPFILQLEWRHTAATVSYITDNSIVFNILARLTSKTS